MTSTEPASDTRPLCGGTPGKPAVVHELTGYRVTESWMGSDVGHPLCPGCANCDLPDTRPRASLELTAADLARLHAGEVVGGYTVTDMGGSREWFTVALAQPAPDTHSGAAAAREDVMAAFERYVAGEGSREDVRAALVAYEAIIPSVDARALQEARERADDLERRLTRTMAMRGDASFAPPCPGHMWSVAVDGHDKGWRECVFCKARERTPEGGSL